MNWGSKAAIIIGGTAILIIAGGSRFAPFVILSLIAVISYWALTNSPGTIPTATIGSASPH